MFVGAINADTRRYYAHIAPLLDGKDIVIGCSGNFTSEAILSEFAPAARVHSNDISFYSTLLGEYFCGRDLPFEIIDPDYAFMAAYCDTPQRKVAAVITLLDMLDFHKRNNVHALRMWDGYLRTFGALHDATMAKLLALPLTIDSYFAGDVAEHYQHFADNPDAIYVCFAPTYAGGYEKLYKAMDTVIRWSPPSYPMLSKERKKALLDWVVARKYIWLTDEPLPDMPVVMHQQSGRAKTVFVYSNLIHDPALLLPKPLGGLPNWKLANRETVLTAKTRINLHKIKTSDLAKFKNAFLAKRVLFAPGMWAFAVLADDEILGFMEFTRSKFGGTDVYIQCDMPVPGTKYKRLSKLIAMLLLAKETKVWLEKLNLGRFSGVYTTAFTMNDNPISMKYRGVLDVAKRGKTPKGESFVNYTAPFSVMSLKGTYNTWLQKNLI